MRYSKSFIHTLRETPTGVEIPSHALTLRAGIIGQVAAGHYSMLPLGQRVVNRLTGVIREEMGSAGALEMAMPILQPAELWRESGRWDVYGDEMFKLTSRAEREFCLGPTHEELIVDTVRSQNAGTASFPVTLFQFGTKFRDELRARSGLLRAREFQMKDAYSFDTSQEGLDASYTTMREAYIRILDRVGIQAFPTQADPGEMGGGKSEEFIAPSAVGEDQFVFLPDGTTKKLEDMADGFEGESHKGIEIAHIFQLGDRYSDAMKLMFKDGDGVDHPVIMGCYGIGITRMIPTIIEQHHDGKGIVWPKEVSPFDVGIVPIRYDQSEVRDATDRVYRQLNDQCISVLLDDRDCSPGIKFKDLDLIGVPTKVIVGPRGIKSNELEIENRADGSKRTVPLDSSLTNQL